MRHIPRKSALVAIAAVATLGVSGTAFGQVNANQTSEMAAGINPQLQDNNDAGKGSLFVQVTTLDTDNNPEVPADSAEVVRIDFPEEMNYKVNGKLDKCNDGAIDDATTDAALEECGSAYIGSGTAFARVPGLPQQELTVSAFNGQTSVAGEQDSDDVPTGGFDGGNPTVVLHADNALVETTVLLGEVRGSQDDAFGEQLNVTDAPDTGNDAGAIVLFNAQVARTWNNGKKGNKKKTYNLINATCGGDGDWDFRTNWIYDGSSTDTFDYTQECARK